MKVKVSLLLIVVSLLLGFLLGTESGRARRDALLVRLGRKEAEADVAFGIAEQVIEDAETAAAATS